MKNFLKLSFCIVLLSVPCLAKSWGNVFPLQTNRLGVLDMLGEPLYDKESGEEYFEFESQKIKFTWTRPDCYGEGTIEDKKLINSESLVYQISIMPKVALKTIESYTANDTKTPASTPGFYWSPYLHSCLGNTNGLVSCSAVNNTDGFGYSSSNQGYTALYFFPSQEENKSWKEKHKPCSSLEGQN